MTNIFITVLTISFLSVGCAYSSAATPTKVTNSTNKINNVWPQNNYITKREMVDLEMPDRSLIIRFDQIIQLKDNDTFSVWKNKIDNLK